jgi:hypothetical protein
VLYLSGLAVALVVVFDSALEEDETAEVAESVLEEEPIGFVVEEEGSEGSLLGACYLGRYRCPIRTRRLHLGRRLV